jgi:hypothetical protein
MARHGGNQTCGFGIRHSRVLAAAMIFLGKLQDEESRRANGAGRDQLRGVPRPDGAKG